MAGVEPNYEETAPVTLEGIAAVLAVVPALIGQASQKERQEALSDALGMLSRACAMAGGKSGPPSEVAVAALEQECSVALDEYAAFRVMGGEVKTLPERIRLLGDSWVRLKIAHEDVRRSLSESERRFSNEAAERMEEAAKTMGDTIRDRLLAILFPGSARPNLDLEDCLREADARLNRNRPPLGNPPPYIVRDAVLEEAAGRVNLVGLADWAKGVVRERIRALKSKPAPVDLHLSAKDEEEILASGGGFSHVSGKTTQSGPAPQPSKNPGEFDPTPRAHLNGCVMDTNHMGPCVAFQPSDTKPEPVQCLVPGCDKPHQHEGPHSESSAPVITEETLRTLRERRETRADIGRQIDALATSDVHDFGWALAQMRAGKKVRRSGWAVTAHVKLNATGEFFENHRGGEFTAGFNDIITSTWQVVE